MFNDCSPNLTVKENHMKLVKHGLIVAALAVGLPLAVQAQANPAATANAPLTSGVVKKVDKEQGKITIKHGPIENLGMPGMTMVFHVTDPKMLATVNEGDPIRFTAENTNGALTVTRLEKAGK